MTLNAIFYVFAAVLYLAAAFGIYKTLQEPEPTEKFWIRPLICAGLMIQAYLIYEALFLYGTPHFGMALALTITLFTCTFLLLLESFFSKIGAMLVFVLPLSAVSMLLPLLLPGSPLAPETASGPFRLHLLLAILAYSVMTMALIQGLLLMAVHKRVRAKLSGTSERPRLNVFRSEKNIYAQVIDDVAGNTLVSASSLDKEIEGNGGNKTAARAVGKLVAERCKAKGIDKVVFDRGGYLYHGRVAELAEGAREGGLEF